MVAEWGSKNDQKNTLFLLGAIHTVGESCPNGAETSAHWQSLLEQDMHPILTL
jgi:hypothetical protein